MARGSLELLSTEVFNDLVPSLLNCMKLSLGDLPKFELLWDSSKTTSSPLEMEYLVDLGLDP